MNTSASDCIFCRIVDGEFDNELIVFQDETTCVFPSLHQRANNRGHMLVIAAPHVPSIYELDWELGAELMQSVSRIAAATKAAFGADGIAIKQHNDQHGGQDVFHLHFHIIPCFEGDGFFRGNQRFPKGMDEVPLEERLKQAERVRHELISPA